MLEQLQREIWSYQPHCGCPREAFPPTPPTAANDSALRPKALRWFPLIELVLGDTGTHFPPHLLVQFVLQQGRTAPQSEALQHPLEDLQSAQKQLALTWALGQIPVLGALPGSAAGGAPLWSVAESTPPESDVVGIPPWSGAVDILLWSGAEGTPPWSDAGGILLWSDAGGTLLENVAA